MFDNFTMENLKCLSKSFHAVELSAIKIYNRAMYSKGLVKHGNNSLDQYKSFLHGMEIDSSSKGSLLLVKILRYTCVLFDKKNNPHVDISERHSSKYPLGAYPHLKVMSSLS